MLTISIAAAIGLLVFGLIWWYVTMAATRLFGKNAPMTFTPTDSAGVLVPFEPRHERYMKVAEVVTTLSSASLIFVPSSRLSVYAHSCAFALVLLWVRNQRVRIDERGLEKVGPSGPLQIVCE